jgi:protein phosphatase
MKTTRPLKSYQFWNQTDVGKVREINEDYMGYFETTNGDLFVVCDGMGGHAAGEIASRLAVESIRDFFKDEFYADVFAALHNALVLANQKVLDYASEHPESTGLGTTAVIVLIREHQLYIAHIGDSRLYLIRKQEIKALTADHSWVNEMIKSGSLSPEEAWNHPRKNQITRALGIPGVMPEVNPDAFIPQPDDIFLLCSDGLNSMLKDESILQIVSKQTNIQTKVQELIEEANNAGGEDNITVQLIHFFPEEVFEEAAKEEAKERNQTLLYAILGLFTLILVVYVIKTFVLSPKTEKIENKTEEIKDSTAVEDSSKVGTDSLEKTAPDSLKNTKK